MRRFLSLLALPMLAAAVAVGGELDLTEWKIRAVPDPEAKAAGEKAFSEELWFLEDKAYFGGAGKLRYPAGPYTVGLTAETAAWESMLKSPEAGSARFEGKVKGGRMTGTVTIRRPAGKPYKFSFRGTRTRDNRPRPERPRLKEKITPLNRPLTPDH